MTLFEKSKKGFKIKNKVAVEDIWVQGNLAEEKVRGDPGRYF